MDRQRKPMLLIGGDIVPTSSNALAFISADIDALVDFQLRETLEAADYTIFNLEAPLVDGRFPIEKCGLNLSAPTETVRGLKALNISAFGLANNHIMDQSYEGLTSTCAALDSVQIGHFGAGKSLDEAADPLFIELGGRRVGVYACAEHEFSIAGADAPGANPFDPLESLDHVRRISGNCDYAIVLYHGGKEYYRYPSPMLQKRCRKLLEAGANLVVCQHSHCIGCAEEWLDGCIVYGQGNFLFDDSESEYLQTGLLVRVEFDDKPTVSYLPVRKNGPAVRSASAVEADEIMKGFRKRSNMITETAFVKDEYAKFAQEYIDGYLRTGIPGSKTLAFRIVNRLFGRKLPSKLLRRHALLSLLNMVECEAHNELFAEGLRAKLGM